MKKVNLADVAAKEYASPRGRFGSRSQDVSLALGAREGGTREGRALQPFEVMLRTIAPGKRNCPYHLHTAEHEFYLVVSGRGQLRHEGGTEEIRAGDCFIFPPGEAHQLICPDEMTEPLVYWVIADNVNGTDACFYPDSGKWNGLPNEGNFRIVKTDYHDGEE